MSGWILGLWESILASKSCFWASRTQFWYLQPQRVNFGVVKVDFGHIGRVWAFGNLILGLNFWYLGVHFFFQCETILGLWEEIQ